MCEKGRDACGSPESSANGLVRRPEVKITGRPGDNGLFATNSPEMMLVYKDAPMAREQKSNHDGELDADLWAKGSLEALREHVGQWDAFLQDACRNLQNQARELFRRQSLVGEWAADMQWMRESASTRLEVEKTRLTTEISELEQRAAGLENEIQSLSSRRSAMAGDETLEPPTAALDTLKTELDAMRAELEAAKAERDGWAQECERLLSNPQQNLESSDPEVIAELERSRLHAAALLEELSESRLELAREREKEQRHLELESASANMNWHAPASERPIARVERPAPRERHVGGSDAVLMSLMQQFEELQQGRKARR